MSYFDDLLSRPLPSAGTSYDESGDDFEKDMEALSKDFESEECGPEDDTDFSSHDEDGDDGIDSIVDDIMNADEDELPDDDEDGDDENDTEDDGDIDSDLADLEREVDVNGSLPDDDGEFGDDDNYVPQSVDDPTPAKPVTGQADEDADRMLAICATPTILDNTLTVEEAVEFIKSGDANIAVNEGLMLESDLASMLAELSDDNGDFTEAVKFASPGKKYMMTKKARLKQLFELSLQIEARAHHDPYYPKIQKAYKIERTIKQGWRKRYGNLAMKRAKRYLKALMSSKSPTLKKAAKRISK